MISLIIPTFNEEQSISTTVERAAHALETLGDAWEILVIDDGSTDGTAERIATLRSDHMHMLTHPRNSGYGASIKTGIRHSKGDILAITDADGTYPLEELPLLIRTLQERQADMVVGARTKKGVCIPLMRRPAKWVVNALANRLAGMKIPDLNSGLRVFRRDLAEQFMHLYPQRFSLTTTMTLAALTNDYLVYFVPITYHKRVGKSTLSSGMNGVKNFFFFLSLVVRIVLYFRPLRFFIWPGAILLLGGTALMLWTLHLEQNISDAGLLLFMTGVQIGLFGLLADVVARQRSVR